MAGRPKRRARQNSGKLKLYAVAPVEAGYEDNEIQEAAVVAATTRREAFLLLAEIGIRPIPSDVKLLSGASMPAGTPPQVLFHERA